MRNIKMEELRIKGNLTPGFINDKLGPFLEAITNIQHTIDDIKQVPPSPIKIDGINWEGVDSIENNIWESTPTVTIFINEAKKALAGLRETIDTFEESSNPTIRRAKTRMAKSYFEAFAVTFELEPELRYLPLLTLFDDTYNKYLEDEAKKSERMKYWLDVIDSSSSTRDEKPIIIVGNTEKGKK